MFSEASTATVSTTCVGDRQRSAEWLSKLGAVACLSLALAGCGGGGSSDSLANQAVSAVLNFLSNGAFKDLDSLVVALEGDNLVIKDFGSSDLGTHTEILPLGTPLVSGIACGPSSCTGQVLVPTMSNGTLISYSREPGTLVQQGDTSVAISSPALGTRTFTRTTVSGTGTTTPTPGTTTPTPPATGAALSKDATCAQWWAAIRGRTWTWVSVPAGEAMPNGTLTFSEVVTNGTTTMRWAINADAMPRPGLTEYDWFPSRSGEVGLTDKFPTLGLCRITLFFDPNKFLGLGNWTGFDSYVGFAYSLSGGRLEFTSPDNGAVKGWIFKATD